MLVQALEGEQNRNKYLDKVVRALDRVQKPHAQATINARLDMKKLFPGKSTLGALPALKPNNNDL